MKTAVDNITLIKRFLQGEESLLANRELRIENVHGENQLLTNQGILLAKGHLKQRFSKIVIRLKSDYWQIIHQLALNASFIPFNIQQERLDGATFAQYEQHTVPAGYRVNCQEASAFWKVWWINHRKLQMMDMLLLFNKRWYPVNQMLCETGTIYVKTWRGEQTLSINDTVIWLDRNTHEQRRRVTIPKHHGSSQRSTSKSQKHNHGTAVSSSQPIVPDDLRQVIKASSNRLIVHTVLGPVVIEGQNLTCALARKGVSLGAKVS